MILNKEQIDTTSKYFSDISKVLFASIVIGYFIHSESVSVTLPAFVFGSIISVASFLFSIKMLSHNK